MKSLRIFSLAITTLYMMSVLIACSNGKMSDISDYSIAGVDRSNANTSTAYVDFVLKSSTPSSQDRELVLDEIEKKLKDKLNVKLSITDAQVGGYNNYLNQILGSGQSRAFFYSEFQLPARYQGALVPARDSYSNLSNLAKKGIATDLTELFPKNAPKLYSRYSKEQLETVSVDGKVYAVPSLFPRSARCCITLRKDLADKYNIKGFNGLEDYTSFLKLIKEREPELVPFAQDLSIKDIFCEKYGYVPVDYLSSLVYKWDDPEMKLYYYTELPGYKEVEKTVSQWSELYTTNGKGEMIPLVMRSSGDKIEVSIIKEDGTKETESIEAMGTDRMYFQGGMERNIDEENGSNVCKLATMVGCGEIDGIVGYQDSQIPLYWNTKQETVTFPLFPDKKARLYSPSDSAFVISSKDNQYVIDVLKFLEWVHSSQENYDLLMYGIKDKHYTLYNEQYVLQGEFAKYGDSEYIGWQCSIPFWNIDYFRTSVDNSPLSKENYMKLVEMNSEYAPHSGFCPDYTPVGSEIETIFYRESINANGMKKVKEEIQKQLDEWRKERKQ